MLDDQACTIQLRFLGTRCYLWLTVGPEAVRSGALVLPGVPIIQGMAPFSGNLYLADVLSPADAPRDPSYEELGTRFKLYYLTAAEMEAL